MFCYRCVIVGQAIEHHSINVVQENISFCIIVRPVFCNCQQIFQQLSPIQESTISAIIMLDQLAKFIFYCRYAYTPNTVYGEV